MTTISFDSCPNDIANLHQLPAQIHLTIRESGSIVVRGFQELLGYHERQLIWSAGGHWTSNKKNAKFIVKNFGSKQYQWDGTTLRTTSHILNV